MTDGIWSRTEQFLASEKSKNDLKLALELISIQHRGGICPQCKAHIDHGSKHIITCKYHEIDMKARNL